MQVIADWGVVVVKIDGIPVEDTVIGGDLVHQLLRDHAPGCD